MYNNVPLDESGLTACIGRSPSLFKYSRSNHVMLPEGALHPEETPTCLYKRVSSIYQWVNPTTFPDTQNLHHP